MEAAGNLHIGWDVLQFDLLQGSSILRGLHHFARELIIMYWLSLLLTYISALLMFQHSSGEIYRGSGTLRACGMVTRRSWWLDLDPGEQYVTPAFPCYPVLFGVLAK